MMMMMLSYKKNAICYTFIYNMVFCKGKCFLQEMVL